MSVETTKNDQGFDKSVRIKDKKLKNIPADKIE